MTKLLYNLLFKIFFGIWNERCNKAFKKLKKLVIIEPKIAHFNLKKETFIKYDFNNIIIENILLQINNKK